jgi:hypothetical protein
MSLKLKSSILFFLIINIFSAHGELSMLENTLSGSFMPNILEKRSFLGRSSRSSSSQVVGKGVIKAKSTVEDLPGFRIYFNGNVAMSDDSGFYAFPVEDTDLSKYRLVVTRRLEHIFDKQNTINNFKVIPDKDYICYTFKKFGRYGSWVKKTKQLDHKKFVLPKNSIVLLLNPKYVDVVEEWDMELRKNVIKMPQIVLKADIHEDDLKRAAAKSLLCLEDTAFHEKVGRTNKSKDPKSIKVKVTLP